MPLIILNRLGRGCLSLFDCMFMEKCNICVIILSSTCCVRRQQKQLGFLWSGMIVKQLITLSLPLPAFSSANCWTIKLSIQFTKAVLWKLFCGSCVVCTARDGNTSQLYGFMLESFFKKNVNINIFSSEIVFFFLWIPFPFYSLSRSLSCWIYEIHLPRREFHTVDCGK